MVKKPSGAGCAPGGKRSSWGVRAMAVMTRTGMWFILGSLRIACVTLIPSRLYDIMRSVMIRSMPCGSASRGISTFGRNSLQVIGSHRFCQMQ